MKKSKEIETSENIKCIFDDKAEKLDEIIEKVFSKYINDEKIIYKTSKRDWLKIT